MSLIPESLRFGRNHSDSLFQLSARGPLVGSVMLQVCTAACQACCAPLESLLTLPAFVSVMVMLSPMRMSQHNKIAKRKGCILSTKRSVCLVESLAWV